MKEKYLILSLDGGGVRCALQLVILKRLFARFPELEKKIKLIAGTSAGALVGAGLGALGPEKMEQHMLSQSFAKKIFTESWTHEVRSMRGLYRANYTSKELEKLLINVFGGSTVLNQYSQSNGPHLLFTSFCIDTTKHADTLLCKKCKKTTIEAKSKEIELKDMTVKTEEPTVKEIPIVCCEKDTNMQVDAIEPKEGIKTDVEESKQLSSKELIAEGLKPEVKAKVDSKWSAFVSNLPSFMRWSSASASTSDVATRNAVIQEACNQQKQHQNPQHKCNCAAWHTKLYHTFEGSGGDVTFVDVLLGSTAAPTYFPSHNGCVDGGVVAQNPALLATSYALKYDKHSDGSSLRLDDIVVLSIGTGSHPMNMNSYGANADLGLAQWVPNLTYLFNDASLDVNDTICRNLLQQQYLRVQVRMPRAVDLSNYNEWNDLVLWAEQEPLDALFNQIQQLFF